MPPIISLWLLFFNYCSCGIYDRISDLVSQGLDNSTAVPSSSTDCLSDSSMTWALLYCSVLWNNHIKLVNKDKLSIFTPEAQIRVKNWAWSFLCPALFLSSPSCLVPRGSSCLRGWRWWGHTEFSVNHCTESLSAAPPCSWSLSLFCWEQSVCSAECWC